MSPIKARCFESSSENARASLHESLLGEAGVDNLFKYSKLTGDGCFETRISADSRCILTDRGLLFTKRKL